MQRYWASLSLGALLLLLSVGLLARGAAPVAAGQLPPIATPKSAHFQLTGAYALSDTTSNESAAITIAGEGAIDTARKAASVAMDLTVNGNLGGQLEDTRLHIELARVDGRLYWLDPGHGRWEWAASPDASATDLLFPSFGAGTFPGNADAFAPVGPEAINGAATTHWRAELDTARLFGTTDRATPAPMAPPGFAMTMVLDAWIGDADRYLYRASMALKLNGTGPQAFSADGSYTLTYSDLDQPATIVAPLRADQAPSTAELTAQLPASLTAAAGPLNVLGGVPAFGRVTAPAGAAVGVGNGGTTATPGAPAGAPRVPAASPTPRPPTAPPAPTAASAALAAGAASGGAQPSVVPAGGAQVPASAQVPSGNGGFPFAFGLAGVGVLLVLAAGLFLLGRRAGS